MELCIVEGCGKKHNSKGYCIKHYSQFRRLGKIKKEGEGRIGKWCGNSCLVNNCDKKIYAKGYCRSHYDFFITRNNVDITKMAGYWKNKVCRVEDCNSKASTMGYCVKHYCRFKKHGDPLKTNRRWLVGKNNPCWNGGVSEYKNHSELKRNRLVKLSESNYKCEICGGEAKEVHHKDRTKSNHTMTNLVALCPPCHHQLHRESKGRPKVYYFGESVENIAKKLRVSRNTITKYVNGYRTSHSRVLKILDDYFIKE